MREVSTPVLDAVWTPNSGKVVCSNLTEPKSCLQYQARGEKSRSLYPSIFIAIFWPTIHIAMSYFVDNFCFCHSPKPLLLGFLVPFNILLMITCTFARDMQLDQITFENFGPYERYLTERSRLIPWSNNF